MSETDELEKLRRENELLKKENQKLKKKLEEAENELKFYKNPHTPPSKLRSKKAAPQKTPKKRGAPIGHKGYTRLKPTPTKFVDVTADICPICGSSKIEVIGIKANLIEEIPEPLPIEYIQFNRHQYNCLDCGETFLAKHEQCPQNGRFGITFLALVIFLKIFMRGVMRKVPVFLQTQNGISISPATVNSILQMVASAAEDEFEALKTEIRKSTRLFVDETSFSVLGKNWWMWIFHSGDKILVVIRKSRGGCVLEEILGADWRGILNCDGWRAYGTLIHAILQRCWAHLLREAKDCATNTSGRHLFIKLTAMFHEAKSFGAEKHTTKQREAKANEMENEMRRLTAYYTRYPELEKLCEYISNGGADWFTAVRYEGIELTNNTAERGLREQVVLRNIMGALRSENVKKYEILCSLFSTWQLDKQDCMANLKKILSTKLCLG